MIYIISEYMLFKNIAWLGQRQISNSTRLYIDVLVYYSLKHFLAKK